MASKLLIDLAAVFTTAYDRGRFARRIVYRVALGEEQKEWVEGVLGDR